VTGGGRPEMSALVLQMALLVSLAGLYLLIGSALSAPTWLPWRRRPNLSLALILGFAGTPLLLGPVALLSRLDLGTSAVLIAGSAAAVLAVWWRQARQQSGAGGDRAQSERESPLLVRTPLYVWMIGMALGLLACWAYLLWSTEVRTPQGRYCAGATVYDFQKHVEITTALTAYGMPGQHQSAAGTPLVWYTGFYTPAAALASLAPAGVLQALVAQILISAVVYALLVYRILLLFWPHSARWRLAGTLLAAVGLSVRPQLFGLDEATARSHTLGRLWPNIAQIDSQIGLMQWLTHHVLAIALVLWVLVNLRRMAEWSRQEWIVFSACSACALAFSSTIGMLYLAVVLLGLLAAACRIRLRPAAVASVWREHRRVLLALALSAAAQGVVVVCYYWSVLQSYGSGSRPGAAGIMFSRADVDVLHNVGWTWETCGLGVLALALRPWLRRWRQGEGLVFALVLVALVVGLDGGRSADIRAKGLYILQIVLPVLSLVVVQLLAEHRRKPVKWSGRLLGAGLAVNALACLLSVGLWWTHMSTANIPTISPEEHNLLDWVHHNTDRTELVTQMEGDHTMFSELLTRVAAASGSNMFPCAQSGWSDERALARYTVEHGDSLDGILRSDYVYVPYEPTGYEIPKHSPLDPAGCKEKLLALGFTIVRENRAGLIARRGRIPPGDHTELLRPGGSLAVVRGYVEEGAYSFALRQLDLPGIDKLDGAAERHYLLAVCLHKLGQRLPEALTHYDRALALGFDEYTVRLHRADVLRQLGEKAKAEQDLLRCEQLRPRGRSARRAA